MRLPYLFLALAALSGLTACGSRSVLDETDDSFQDGGPDTGVPPPPVTCGNNKCDNGESCTNCSVDCGLCNSCGNGKCDTGENCSACPQDCGICGGCFDGVCQGPAENCLTCAPDCGQCAGCGDGICDKTKSENCFTCPKDCGNCAGCGDGICDMNETCASCPHDCGVCSFCGNAKCEAYETCSNCPADCGMCTTLSCFAAFTCAIKCVDPKQNPPKVSISCVANCLAQGCPDTQFFFDQAFNCAIFKGFPKCGNDFACIQKVCDAEIAACIGAGCPGH